MIRRVSGNTGGTRLSVCPGEVDGDGINVYPDHKAGAAGPGAAGQDAGAGTNIEDSHPGPLSAQQVDSLRA